MNEESKEIIVRVNAEQFADYYEIRDITDIESYEMGELLSDYLAEYYPTMKIQNWEFSMDETTIIIYALAR